MIFLIVVGVLCGLAGAIGAVVFAELAFAAAFRR